MRLHYPDHCCLNVGKYKTLHVAVTLDIGENKQVTGELSFESPPLAWNDQHVKKNSTGTLTVADGEDSSKFNVLLVESTNEHTLIKDRLKRYFWLFFVIGKPIYDSLEIFPVETMKVFTSTDFRGLWPVGVSSVVIAQDMRAARSLLTAALKKSGIDQPEIKDLTLQELDLSCPTALVLNKGEY